MFYFQIRDFYWGAELDVNNPKGLVDAISDSSYAHPIDTAAKIHAMKSNANVIELISIEGTRLHNLVTVLLEIE